MSLLTKVIQPVNVWTTKTFLGRRPWNEGLMRYNQRKLKELQRACIAIREVSSLPPTPNKAVTLERFENQEGKDNGSQNEWVSQSLLHAQLWVFLPRLTTQEELGGGALKEKSKAGKETHTFLLFPDSSDSALARQGKGPLGRQWTSALHSSISPWAR